MKMDTQKMTPTQLRLNLSHDLKRFCSATENFKSPKVLYDGDEFHYYFSKNDVEKILNSQGQCEISFTESVCLYEDSIRNLIKNATWETELQDYVDWIKENKLKINMHGDDFTQVYGSGRMTNRTKLLHKLSSINTNLALSYPWFFFFYACWYKNQYCEGKGGIGYIGGEANNKEYQEYCAKKNFIHKSFEIKKQKHYIFRISVEANGQFVVLHSDEFIKNLIYLVSSCSRASLNKIHFNDKRESVHYIYVSDEFCSSKEVVILSMQFFDI